MTIMSYKRKDNIMKLNKGYHLNNNSLIDIDTLYKQLKMTCDFTYKRYVKYNDLRQIIRHHIKSEDK